MFDLCPFHERKRDAVCEADILIGEFGEPINGSELVVALWSPYLQHIRGINSFQPIAREHMARPPAQQSGGLVQDKVAGNKSFISGFELLPKSRGQIVVLILGQVAGQIGPGVNIYHTLHVILVEMRIVVEADIHRHLTLIHLLIGK